MAPLVIGVAAALVLLVSVAAVELLRRRGRDAPARPAHQPIAGPTPTNHPSPDSTGPYRTAIAPTDADLTRLFPHLEVGPLLGRGGMGAVYQARQVRLDRIVALKLLPPRAEADPHFAERFLREARTLARLSHPGI